MVTRTMELATPDEGGDKRDMQALSDSLNMPPVPEGGGRVYDMARVHRVSGRVAMIPGLAEAMRVDRFMPTPHVPELHPATTGAEVFWSRR